MKILLVITKAEIGGAQMSVLNLARGLKNRGHDVTVGFGVGDFLPLELEKEKISYIRFKQLKRTHNFFANFLFILEIKKFLANNNFDVVHFNSSNALLGSIGAKLANKKIRTIFTFRGMSILDEQYHKNKFLKFVYFYFFKFLLLFVDQPIFVSLDNLRKFGQGKLTKRGKLIYNGLDSSRLDFLPAKEAKKKLAELVSVDLSEKCLIGSIGRLDYQKNYEFLINIFPKILEIKPEATAVIIGDGPERKRLEKLIKDLNLSLKIFILGSIDYASRLLKAVDLFVLTSRYEGLSISLIEAQLSGIKILASRTGGNQEITSDDKDELYEPDNQVDFLNKFKNIINREEEVFSSDKNLLEKFNLEKTVENYEKVYSIIF